MDRCRPFNKRAASLVPYDASQPPAKIYLNLNENPLGPTQQVREKIIEAARTFDFNRYPDPEARSLAAQIAAHEGLDANQVVIGNGGDELLFNFFLLWGGEGRTLLNVPPTFSVYEINAHLTGTRVVNIERNENFQINEDAVLERLEQGDIDMVVLTSPNNPTGDLVSQDFLIQVLEATDAAVLVDEAYHEFAGTTAVPLLEKYSNLLILRTFSKAYGLAGMRLGYVMASPKIISGFKTVRQPYSVNAFTQRVASLVYKEQDEAQKAVDKIVQTRDWLAEELAALPGMKVFPSRANYLLICHNRAPELARDLLARFGILVRNYGSGRLEKCLRITIGTPDEIQQLLSSLKILLDEDFDNQQ